MIDSTTLASAIQTQIADTVEKSVQQYVENIVRTLAMDDAWIEKMEQQINESITRKFGQRLSVVDINSLVMGAIEPAVKLYFERQHPLPSGIVDQAQTTQLTVEDDGVKIGQKLSAHDLEVSGDANIAKTLIVKDLAVRGSINIDNRSWQQLSAGIAQQTQDSLTQSWRDQMVKSVVELIKSEGISFDSIRIGGQSLLDGHVLSAGVRHSSLTRVGNLENLTVTGSVDLGNSLSVRPRRVGINTEHPDMALAIWDEEVALVFGKQKDQTAYMGTLRPQRLTIGVNRQTAIDVDDRGRVTVNHLTIGRHRICHEAECPNYSGTKGDIVFNSNPKNDGVWGWQCLGAFRWTPLRTA